MIGETKIVGVCISELHAAAKAEQIVKLNRELREYGIKMIVFNSLSNIYDNSVYDAGASTVFNFIDFSYVDCLILFDRGFSTKILGQDLVAKAKENGIPVIAMNSEMEGCFSVMDDFKTSYRNLIRHVIREHNARDTFFMSGFRWNPESLDRLACYKKALGEENLSFDESMVGYGEYWDAPARKALDELLATRNRPPRAIFCANDCMAMAVITRLKERGFKVPEDVIVTGYDGIEEGKYFIPNISTVKEDSDETARACAKLVNDIFEGNPVNTVTKIPYKVIYNESCGCPSCEDFSNYRNRMAACMKKARDMDGHETEVFAGVDRFLNGKSLPEILEVMSDYYLKENSYLCIRALLLESLGIMYKSDFKIDSKQEYAVMSSDSKEEYGIEEVDLSRLVPNIDKWIKDDSICVVNSLYVEDYQYGMYIFKSTDIQTMSDRVNRISRALNLVFATVYTRMIQVGMQNELEMIPFIDQVTQVANLKGLNKWFNEFTQKSGNQDNPIAVTVFKIDKYRYIYDNYGVEESENVAQEVANILLRCNAGKKFIARTSDDEFVMVDYSFTNEDEEEIYKQANDRASTCISAIENYNAMHLKDYTIAINTGINITGRNWNTDIRSLVKLACGEMYYDMLSEKRNHYADSNNVNEEGKDYYDELMLILEKNLLTYHFQPIVDAKSGEIFAYEALMRTTDGINISPLVLLETAYKYNKLYDLEKMTLFGIMDYYVENFEKFKGRRVFINSIPGHFLNDEDFEYFTEKYKDYLKYCVFEITEQDSVSDNELNKIKTLTIDEAEALLAVDDYGSGQSNIQNLLRYAPNIVKIDRFLIQDVPNDTNKQLFISNIVEFARLNDMKVVGEGVENQEELQTVMGYGVDYIQGYYTARPNAEPLNELPREIFEMVEKLKK